MFNTTISSPSSKVDALYPSICLELSVPGPQPPSFCLSSHVQLLNKIYFTATRAVRFFAATNFAAAANCCDRSFCRYLMKRMKRSSTLQRS